MGIPASQYVDAWCSPQPGRANDLQTAQGRLRQSCGRGLATYLVAAFLAGAANAESIRIATYAAPLSRDGPGLLLRDIGRDHDQLDAILSVIDMVNPDILLLTDFDYDYDNLALTAFADRAGYPHQFATRPNTGQMTDQDLDQNGKLGEARDAHGYGRFPGDGGMAVLSRWPIDDRKVRDFSTLLWRDLPGSTLPENWPAAVNDIQRLSTAGHWVVPISAPGGTLNLLAFAATPPVFDGPEDRNGLRNRDELRFWTLLLDGQYGPAPQSFVIAGNANLDPRDGQGISLTMAQFLSDPRLQDLRPISAGADIPDPKQNGDPATDTVDWPQDGPGNLRVSYVLPAADWNVTDAGVFWPLPDAASPLGADGLLAGPHRLVWVDVMR